MKKGQNASENSENLPKQFVLVIPNIRSAHNVGSLFRTADGAGVSKVYLCGYTPRLLDRFGRLGKPQKEIAKTALGAELVIPNEYFETLSEAVANLKEKGFVIIGLEQSEKAIKLGSILNAVSDDNAFKKLIKNSPAIALVVGEEVSGMTAEDVLLMDHLIELPMRGKKESLNVSVAGGIAMYAIANEIAV